jgi:hypothetical protein
MRFFAVNSVAIKLTWLLGCCLTGSVVMHVGAAAQTAAAPATAALKPQRADPLDPLDPRARVPPMRYASPLLSYRLAGDVPLLSWREANDEVARIGGWRVYARQAQQAEAMPVPAAAPASVPASAPQPRPKPAEHSGHAGHRPP